MIPAKHSGRGSGACATGGTHPLYCKKCGKPIRVVRGKKDFDYVLGVTFGGVEICGKCRRK